MPLYCWGRQLWALGRRPRDCDVPRVSQGSPANSPLRLSPANSPIPSPCGLYYELHDEEEGLESKPKNRVKLAPVLWCLFLWQCCVVLAIFLSNGLESQVLDANCTAFLDSVIVQHPYSQQSAAVWEGWWPWGGDEDGVLGSPSICEVSGTGLLVATNDLVKSPVVEVHHSTDGGATWKKVSTVEPAFWATVFWHEGALYLFGTTGEYTDLAVYRSNDIGLTWTVPGDSASGLLTEGEQWHRAPTPMVLDNGRLWTAVESYGGRWPESFQSVVVSAPVDADLLDARSWQISAAVPYPRFSWDRPWPWQGFLEGNFVVAPDGGYLVVLREHRYRGGSAAVVHVDHSGLSGEYTESIVFPGGAKKMSIKYDPESGLYWTLSSYLQSTSVGPKGTLLLPLSTRFRQAKDVRQWQLLMSSRNLQEWRYHRVVVETCKSESASYSDFIFSGDDLLVVLRCAINTNDGWKPVSTNAGNTLGFKRVPKFREAAMANDQVVIIDNRWWP